jgi:hypothetical protein
LEQKKVKETLHEETQRHNFPVQESSKANRLDQSQDHSQQYETNRLLDVLQVPVLRTSNDAANDFTEIVVDAQRSGSTETIYLQVDQDIQGRHLQGRFRQDTVVAKGQTCYVYAVNALFAASGKAPRASRDGGTIKVHH